MFLRPFGAGIFKARGLRFDELAPSFLALACRKLLASATGTKRIRAHVEVTKFFRSGLATTSALPHKDGITTGANLSSRALRDSVDTLGLDFASYETKARLIDEALLHSRNTIAHGEYLLVDEERYEEISREVLGMMDVFRTEVQNAAVLRFKAA